MNMRNIWIITMGSVLLLGGVFITWTDGDSLWTAVTYLIIAVIQWLILSRYLPDMRLWVPASVAGLIFPPLISSLMQDSNSILIAVVLPIILMGIGLSFFQWLVLRRLFHRSGWWFLANGLGWAAFLLGWGFWSVSVFYDSNPGGAFLFFFAGAFIYSVATGYTLDWFMKHWKDEASTMIRQ